jgi:hypothetical protein
MAETGQDNNTSDPEWRWPIEAREFMAGLLRGSDEEADRILREALDENILDWCHDWCGDIVIEPVEPRKTIKLEVAAELVGVRRIFWRRQSHTTIDIDYSRHRVIRTGPPWVFHKGPPISMRWTDDGLDIEAPNFLYDEPPVFLLGESKIRVTATLVKFRHEGIIRTCRHFGLLAPASMVVAATPQESLVPKTAQQDPRPGRLQELLRTGQLRGPQMEKIAAAVPEIFPPDGCIPETLKAADLETLILDHWRRQATEKKKKTPAFPSIWHTCNRLLARYRQHT